jgi:hypothetical protein
MDEALPPAFFLSESDGYVATALCRGPWDDASCHGGPVAALIGREVERFDPDPDLLTVRLTIELLKPVPLGPLRLEATTLRPGKRVRIVGISVMAGEAEVVRATALRVLRAADDVPAVRPVEGFRFLPPVDAVPVGAFFPRDRIGITNALEMRAAAGSAVDLGPATYWFRLTAPLVDDEPVLPIDTALVAADFGNGLSSVVPIESHLFINPDLTVYLNRQPTGEWIANDAHTWLEPGGRSVAEASLHDADGPIGRATQSLYVAAR